MNRLPSIKLTLQYDGTRYAGFQRQPNGITIQEKIENALRRTTGDEGLKIGAAAGRTDAGVHARGQVVNFRSESRIPVDRWPHALNQHLPDDIVVVGAEAVPDEFHARYWAISKRYRYTIEHASFQSPMTRLYAYHWAKELNLDLMRRAALLIEGTHDFAAFRSTGGSAKTSVRSVSRVVLTTAGPLIHIDIAADGFLYNMVRIIAGTLLEVGSGRRTLDTVKRALETGQRSFAGKTLAAHGLSLEEVTYGDGPKRAPWEQDEETE